MGENEGGVLHGIQVECIIPILRVADLQKSLRSVHERCRSRGAQIVSPPENFAWAYEFRVADPDGHVLRLGSEPRD